MFDAKYLAAKTRIYYYKIVHSTHPHTCITCVWHNIQMVKMLSAVHEVVITALICPMSLPTHLCIIIRYHTTPTRLLSQSVIGYTHSFSRMMRSRHSPTVFIRIYKNTCLLPSKNVLMISYMSDIIFSLQGLSWEIGLWLVIKICRRRTEIESWTGFNRLDHRFIYIKRFLFFI